LKSYVDKRYQKINTGIHMNIHTLKKEVEEDDFGKNLKFCNFYFIL